MDIAALLAKLKKGEALTEDEEKAILAISTDAAKYKTAADEEKAKAARILAEKKERDARLAELESQLEELQTKDLTEIDRFKQLTEKQQAQLQKIQEQFQQESEAHKQTRRLHDLDRIHGGVKWNRGVVNDADSRLLVGNALASVADLSDADAVKAALDPFLAERKSYILADVPSGTGAKNDGAGRAGAAAGGTKVDLTNIGAIDRKTLLSSIEQLDTVAAQMA